MRGLTAIGLAVGLGTVLAGCGGDSSSAGDPRAQVFLTDAPAEDLDDFVLSIDQITLVSEDGGEAILFSGGMIEEDLLELQMVEQLVASASFPAGVYVGLKMLVSGISATANSVPQTVLLAGGGSLPAEFEVVFKDPMTLLPGSQAMITLDYDVEDSVTDGGGDSIVVESVLFADVRTKHVDLEDFEGTVQLINLDAGTFDVMVIESSGPGSAEPVGVVTVQVDSETLYEAEDNAFMEGMAGLTLLFPGQSVEVEGTFDDGMVMADVVEAEESGGGAGNFLEFEGLVTATTIDGVNGATDTATLAILKVKKDPGSQLTGLSALVDLESQFPAFKAEIGDFPDVRDVVIAEKLEVQGTSDGTTVTAWVVRLEKTRFEGIISMVDSNSIRIDSLIVERRTVPSLTTRTFAITTPTAITVDDVLTIPVTDLETGQEVEVKGALDADDTNLNSWVALEIELEGRDFDGRRSDVVSIADGSFEMRADGTDLGLANPVTLTVNALDNALGQTKILFVENDTDTMVPLGELAPTLSGLEPTARVKVEGILDSNGDLTATEILLIP